MGRSAKSIMNKEWLVYFLMFVLTLTVFGAGIKSEAQQITQSAREQELAKLIQGAKAEGKVIWGDGLKPEEAAPIIEAFQKKYPFLKVEHTRIHGTDSRERLLREMMAGIVRFDVFDIGGEEIPDFQMAGLLAKYDWTKAFNLRPEQIESDGSLIVIGSHVFGPAYNTKLVKPEDLPKSWEDLLHPKWQGKMVVDTRPKVFMGLIPAWGEGRVLDFAKKVVANKPQFRRGQTETIQLMAAGEYSLHSGTQYDSVFNVRRKGGPVEFIALEPLPVSLEDEAVAQGALHPNAAKLLLGFIATEGQEIYDRDSGRGLPFLGYPSETSKKFGPFKKSIKTAEWVQRESELTQKILKAMGKE